MAEITLTLDQARDLLEALDIGLGAAGQVAAEYHEAMKGYRENEHKRLDEDAAKVNAAVTMLGQLLDAAIDGVLGTSAQAKALSNPPEVIAAEFDRMVGRASEDAVRHIDTVLAALVDIKPMALYGEPGTYDTVQARRQRALAQAEEALLALRRKLRTDGVKGLGDA